jgi:virginiamycin A acetyltransferase
VIGHDVWLGQGVRVLPGARIGSGCIIGSGAVVAGEIPPYAIVAGNPARVIRMRFSEDIIARLLELCWWDWPIERILQNEEALCAGNLRLLQGA